MPTKNDALLVVNAGSSSLKFQIFKISGQSLERLQRGQIDSIGVRPSFSVRDGGGNSLASQAWSVDEVPDLPTAISKLAAWIESLDEINLCALGHRVVHGGPNFSTPVLINSDVLNKLSAYQELAPLHQPNSLAPIRLAMELAPDLPQIACFDTAFHRSHQTHTERYALPEKYYLQGVRRYGFHGLSYDYISRQLTKVAPEISDARVIVAHLGSGASLCALKDGKSVETTMGFTALDGLPMSTRSGQLDPGVVMYLVSHMGMSIAEVTQLLYHESGLKGMSGISHDMRELLASGDARAKLAIDHFIHRCGLYVGMLAAAMNGIDGFVFTAGIGENSPVIRSRLARTFRWLGATLNEDANVSGALKISKPDSKIAIYVVPTDEELIIANETLSFLKANRFI